MNCGNVSALNNSINNVTLLNQTSPGIWLLNTNIVNNESNTFYINSSDVTWLKINSTGAINSTSFNITNLGILEINSTKITSWNTTTGDVEGLNNSNPSYDPKGRGYIRSLESSAVMRINNSNISYLGNYCNWVCGTYGITFDTNSSNGTLYNNTMINNYAIVWNSGASNGSIDSNQIKSNYSRTILSYWVGQSLALNISNNIIDYYTLPFFSSQAYQAIDLNANYNIVYNNTIHTNSVGIILYDNYNTITNNNIVSSGVGLHFAGSDYNILKNNIVISTGANNVLLDTSQSNFNYFENETYTKTVSAHAPISLENDASHNLFENLTVTTSSSNRGFGISGGTNNTVRNSTIYNTNPNGYSGLYLYGGATGVTVNNSRINTSGVSIFDDATIDDSTGGNVLNNVTLNGKVEVKLTSGTDVLNDVLFNSSNVTLTGTGRINVSFTVTTNVSHSNYTEIIIRSDGVTDKSVSTINNLTSALLYSYYRNATAWINYTPHQFIINNFSTSPRKWYNITNYSGSQLQYSNLSGYLMFNSSVNLKSLLTIEDYADTEPPKSITNLQNTTNTTSANWTWTDPIDVDFDHIEVYVNGSKITDIIKGVQYYLNSSLSPGTEYIISTHTVDALGNVNQTWVNDTAITKPSTTPPTPNAITTYVSNTCVSVLNWGVVGSALLVVLVLVIAGSLAIGFMTGKLSHDTFPIIEFMYVLIAVVCIGVIGVGIISPIVNLSCP